MAFIISQGLHHTCELQMLTTPTIAGSWVGGARNERYIISRSIV